MSKELKEALEVLIIALGEDKTEGSYYHAWQSNIAMAFKDEYSRFNPNMHKDNVEILHNIANNAARNFLDLLCEPLNDEA